jgi:site-specific DNA-methyltransferase (adenine-specific)
MAGTHGVTNGAAMLYNMDAVAGAAEHIAANSIDLIVTDPPYGINGGSLGRHYNRDESLVVAGYIDVAPEQYADFTRSWIAQAERILRPGGSMYIVSGYTNLGDILNALRGTDLRLVNHIIWKYSFGVFTRRKYVSSHYHILYCVKRGGKRTFNLQARYALNETTPDGGKANYRDREDVWVIPREYKAGREKNANELPQALLAKMLQYSSNEGDLVCDFFFGSGSTARCAIGMNRRFVGFERSTPAFDSAVRRISDVAAGELLPLLRMPDNGESCVENAGKPWSDDAVDAVIARHKELAREGLRQGVIVERLCEEFGRGGWAIRKLLKARAAAATSPTRMRSAERTNMRAAASSS